MGIHHLGWFMDMRTNTYLYIIPILFISACSVYKTPLLYGKCGKAYYVCTQVLLKPNNEFEYFQFYDVGGGMVVKGTWSENKDTITLNTYEQQKDRISEVIETTGNSDSLEFRLLHDGAYIFFDSTSFSILPDYPKMLKFQKNERLTGFYLVFFSDPKWNPIYYAVKDSAARNFLINARILKSPLFIKNEKYVRKGKRLYWGTDSSGSYTGQYHYKREKLSNKQFK